MERVILGDITTTLSSLLRHTTGSKMAEVAKVYLLSVTTTLRHIAIVTNCHVTIGGGRGQ